MPRKTGRIVAHAVQLVSPVKFVAQDNVLFLVLQGRATVVESVLTCRPTEPTVGPVLRHVTPVRFVRVDNVRCLACRV